MFMSTRETCWTYRSKFISALALTWIFLSLSSGFAAEGSGETASANAAAKAERADERMSMVARQIESRGVDDPKVLAAMRSAPRHRFVPENAKRRAYADSPLPIGHGQTISQPYIVAYMTEALEIGKGDKVLEIGTGSGYQAAVLAEITDEVFTIEIVEPLAKRAARDLKEAGYDAVATRHADGYYGWESEAPFDAIIVTAAARSIPPPLVEQLKEGGRMIIPVGPAFGMQRLVLVQKDSGGEIRTDSLMPVRFVPFTGKGQARE